MRRVAFSAILALAACEETSREHRRGGDAQRPTKPPDSVQLAQYVGGGCPHRPPIPPVPRAIFDIYLGSGQETRVPSDADIAELERRGARVLHRFHVDAVRAELDTATARALVSGRKAVAQMATQVWDSMRFTIPLQIHYSRPFTREDSIFLARLIGRPGPQTRRPRPVVYVELEDSLIPVLLRAAGVQFARARTFGCAFLGR